MNIHQNVKWDFFEVNHLIRFQKDSVILLVMIKSNLQKTEKSETCQIREGIKTSGLLLRAVSVIKRKRHYKLTMQKRLK